MFYIAHESGKLFATKAPEGQFMAPRYFTANIAEAATFETFGEAAEVSQNFGPEWQVAGGAA